jgi:uncharacterized damage-inducible protein DinB
MEDFCRLPAAPYLFYTRSFEGEVLECVHRSPLENGPLRTLCDKELPMPFGAALLPEFDQEMATTRRVLERVPSDKATWKPHPKSFPLGHLAQLVSWMPGWITTTLREPALDLAKGGGYSFETTETLLHGFESNVAGARVALQETPDDVWAATWSLVHGSQVLWAAPRTVVVRNHVNHLIHHRAQLTVYLRLLDVPVPATYGPSADERTF